MLSGCDGGEAADRDDPLDVAEAYAIADHELDHGTVYDLLGPDVLEGADRQEWIEQQEPGPDHTGYLSRRYTNDRCDARQEGGREVVNVEPRRQGESDPMTMSMDPGLQVVLVVVEFGNGDTLECLYGLREGPEGDFEVVATEEP